MITVILRCHIVTVVADTTVCFFRLGTGGKGFSGISGLSSCGGLRDTGGSSG